MPREILTTSRGLRTEFEQSISGDIVRALVEIITNADDSYTRSEKNGPIHLAFGRSGKGPERDIQRVSVTDHAEGMNEADISLAADVGVEASGFATKKTVRGLLGRGLKQAAFGIGVGAEIDSIKNGILSVARLYDGPQRRCMIAKGSEFAALGEPDGSPTIPTKEDRERLGLPSDGTRVTLLVTKELWTTHQHQDVIRERLQTHYALRALLKSSANRPVSITDPSGALYGPLEYTNPKASPEKPVLSTPLPIDGFPDAVAHLKIYRATIDLGPIDEYSESGVIVYSEGVPITQTFFGRENHSLAGRFYGRLKCDYIADLLRMENAKGSIKLITLQRMGLVPNHPFAKALFRAAQIHVDKLLRDESDREKKQQGDDKDKGLNKALNDLVPELNKLLAALLDPLREPGQVINPDGPTPPPPPPPPPPPWYQPLEDIEFYPEEIGVRVHAEKKTALYLRDAAFTNRQKLKVTVEGEGVKVLSKDLEVDHLRSSTRDESGPIGYSKLAFRLEGVQAGTNAIVHVFVGHSEAMLLVTVGSHTEPQPKPKPKGAILREITFGPIDGKYRAHFDSVTGTLKVNESHPLQRYFADLRHEKDRVKRRPWVTAVADAMTEALCRVIISTMIEERGTIPRNSGWDKTMTELDSLWYSLGTGVHKAVESKLLGVS